MRYLVPQTVVFSLVICSNLIFSDESPNIKVTQVRQLVLETCQTHPDTYYPLDLEQFKTKDWIIERYLKESSMDVAEAAQSIVDTLHFYKTEKLQELTDSYFPAEFYATGFLIENGVSRKNESVSGFSIRCLIPFGDVSEEMYELGRKFLLFFLYKHRMELDPGGRVFYVTLDRIEFANLDIRFLYNVVTFMNNYVPQQPGTYLVLDLSFIFKMTFQVLINLLNYSARKNIYFSSMKYINKWVDSKYIPTYVGGKYKNYNRIPKGVKSGRCLPHLKHIPKEQWQIYKNKSLKCIKEGMTENNFKSIDKYLRYC